jgi:stearoyl-CoA desaturase (delta-9 desaturase)
MNTQLLYGLLPLPLWGYVVVTFALIQVMLLGITLYLHRDQSHGGLELHPTLRHFFRFWLWLSSGTVTREWVAVHRRHHAYADRHGDPHSPVVFGLSRVLGEGYELYAAAARDPSIVANYGRGTPDDRIERNLYSRFPKLGLVFFILIQLALFGVAGITMLAVQLAAQPVLAAGVINGFGHAVGYRSFELPTAATNIVPWGILIAGEELHNNHHAFPSSPRFSVQRWEIDIGWLWIRLFRAFGLARVHNLPPVPKFVPGRDSIDSDTVQSLFKNRLHVLREYRRRVILPVYRDVVRRRDASMPEYSTPKPLVLHPALLDTKARENLGMLTRRHEVLRAVIEFRDRLQAIWDGTSTADGRAVQQLRELCNLARASPVAALRDFAARLRWYGPPAS